MAVISSDSPSYLAWAVHGLLDRGAWCELAHAFYNVAAEFPADRLQTVFESAISSALSVSLVRYGESARAGAYT